jgi:hypothetical protein
MTLSVNNTASLQVTQTEPLSEISVVFGMALSPSGSQLYLSGQANFQGTDIFTLDLATQALMSVSVVVAGNVAVSPHGTVYVGAGSEVVVFDPASQSVTGTLPAFSNGSLALNATGSRLYFLNAYSSTLAATAPPPAATVLGTAATGFLASAAYDATHRLLLAADSANNIEVLNASTLAPAGNLFIPDSTYAYLTANGGSGFVTMGQTPQVLRIDPVSLKITGTVSLPNRIYDTVSYSQPVMNGSTLYVPFAFTPNGASTARPKTGVAVVDTLRMKLAATWPFQTLPLLGLAQGSSMAYAVVPAGRQLLDLEEIDLSTGAVTLKVQIPGQNTSNTYSNPAVSPDGSTVYFSTNNTLYTFDGKTLAVTNTVSGIGLTNLSVSPDGNYLYGGTAVACETCASPYSLQIVSTSTLQVVESLPSAQRRDPPCSSAIEGE